MAKTRANNEGNIKLRLDGRYEVRVTVDYDKMTGQPKRVSKYAKTKEEAVKLLNQMSFMNDTSPNSFTRVTLGDWLDLCLEVYMKHTLKQSTYLSYDDNLKRQFIVTRDDLLQLGAPNVSAKDYITKNKQDYYDIVEVIKHAFNIADEINIYMFNLILQKEWQRLIAARYTIREYIGIDWQGAYLVWRNSKYPENHLLHLAQIDVSKHAMNAICSIAAKSIHLS